MGLSRTSPSVRGYRDDMRLPLVPSPSDVRSLLEAGSDLLERVLATGPRVVGLLDDAERLVRSVDALIARIEGTRQAADALIERIGEPVSHIERLVDVLEPALTTVQPTLQRLADTTHPSEVDALVTLVDHLPGLVGQLERDIVPILGSLGSVAPDLHDLLDVSRELNEILGKVPGLGRIKRRVDEQQAEEAARRE